MKTVVSVSELNSLELRPSSLLEEWRRLVRVDIEAKWKNKHGWVEADWPSSSSGFKFAFNKNGFDYVERNACGSIYALHRPNEDQVWDWYRNADSSIFWREKMLPGVHSYQLSALTEPRVDWILSGLAELHPSASDIIDISTYGLGTLESILHQRPDLNIFAMGMTVDLEKKLEETAIPMSPTKISELASKALGVDVILGFDILDRAHSLSHLIAALKNNLKIGGLLFANASVSSGLEIQSLWGESFLITPPDKLNLPSINALKNFFSAPDWELVELSTPGVLDIDLIMRAMKEGGNKLWPRSLRVLIEGASEHGADALIELLQSQRLSSYARFIAKRIQ